MGELTLGTHSISTLCEMILRKPGTCSWLRNSATTIISQNALINQFQKVNSPTKLSTCCLLLLS